MINSKNKQSFAKMAAILFVLIGLTSACRPPRAPIIKRPLEIKTQPSTPSSPTPSVLPKKDKVKIGIRWDVTEASVQSEGEIEAHLLDSDRRRVLSPGSYMFRVKNGVLYLGDDELGKSVRLRSLDENIFLQSRTNSYRGTFLIKADQGNVFHIVNELGIDDYLKGVLPREVVVTWAEEGLKVQAVASRTYLASHLGSHSKQGFDLCSDVHCQVYGGMTKEHPRTNQAVDDTQGQILVYQGSPIGAFFHSNCGGTTEEIQPVWGSVNRPYLPRKKCSYGTADPRYNWKISFNKNDILEALKSKTEVRGTNLKSLKIKKKSLSGRAEKISVVTNQGEYTLSGNAFRIAMHPEKIRSTLFQTFEKHGDGYTFAGRGWGHGVGMCQWGAKGQAENGRNYKEILSFYYPHTELKLWSR